MLIGLKRLGRKFGGGFVEYRSAPVRINALHVLR